jgi:hypothetical protein
LLETEFDILTHMLDDLSAQAQPLDQDAIAILIFAAEIGQQPPAATDELKQPSARVVIVRVLLQMFDQLVDTLGQQRNLNLGRTSVAAMDLIISDDIGLMISF